MILPINKTTIDPIAVELPPINTIKDINQELEPEVVD